MPRIPKSPKPPKPPKPNTRSAEQAGSAPPKRQAGERADDAELIKRERVMNEMVLFSTSRQQRLVLMQREFPGITEAAIDKLFTRVNKALEEDAIDLARNEKAKQKRRLLGHISAFKAKGQGGPVMQGERLYADIAGTMAPVRHSHEHTVSQSFRAAFEESTSQLDEQQIAGLLAGEVVPMGAAMGASIDVEGEEVSKVTNGANGKPHD